MQGRRAVRYGTSAVTYSPAFGEDPVLGRDQHPIHHICRVLVRLHRCSLAWSYSDEHVERVLAALFKLRSYR